LKFCPGAFMHCCCTLSARPIPSTVAYRSLLQKSPIYTKRSNGGDQCKISEQENNIPCLFSFLLFSPFFSCCFPSLCLSISLKFCLWPPSTVAYRSLLQKRPIKETTFCRSSPARAHSDGETSTHCDTLEHTGSRCNTLQHTATHCNTLQHKRTATAAPALRTS